jgi:hypothetical protein
LGEQPFIDARLQGFVVPRSKHWDEVENIFIDAQIRDYVTQRLGELENALAPLCGSACRSFGVGADPEIESAMVTRMTESRNDFVLLYNPAGTRGPYLYSHSLMTYMIAHELGHFVDIAIARSDIENKWRRELIADAIAGCAIEAIGMRDELVRDAIAAVSSPPDSLELRLELICGADANHPAIRWTLEALDIGERLCRGSVAPLTRLEAEIDDLAAEAARVADRTRRSFPPHTDPCRDRQLEAALRAPRRAQ